MMRKLAGIVFESTAVFIFIVPVFALFVLTVYGLSHNENKYNQPKSDGQHACVRVGSVCYNLEQVTTNQQRIKGLSGRDSMPEKDGMLFVFDAPDEQCMWMKDMKISNDMVWLDESKKAIQIKENIAPETYPATFCSETPAKYVIELNAGQIVSNGLRLGDTVSF